MEQQGFYYFGDPLTQQPKSHCFLAGALGFVTFGCHGFDWHSGYFFLTQSTLKSQVFSFLLSWEQLFSYCLVFTEGQAKISRVVRLTAKFYLHFFESVSHSLVGHLHLRLNSIRSSTNLVFSASSMVYHGGFSQGNLKGKGFLKQPTSTAKVLENFCWLLQVDWRLTW